MTMESKIKHIPPNVRTSLNHIFEYLWGRKAHNNLKDLRLESPSSLNAFKKYATMTLQASMVAIDQSAQICDDTWKKEANKIIKSSLEEIDSCKSMEELTAYLATSYIKLSYHQLGFIPDRLHENLNITLRKTDWKLTKFRTVRYVQTKEQEAKLNKHLQDKEKRKHAKDV